MTYIGQGGSAMMSMIAALALALASGKGGTPTVTAAHFLVSNGQLEAVETTIVPYLPGTSCYTWRLEVAPEDRDLSVREEFELPGSPPTWGEEPTGFTAVNRDRSTAVTEFMDSLGDGMISHGWCVAQGDPSGAHRIRVFAGDRLLHEFRFTVFEQPY
jgi:hypothetical protein